MEGARELESTHAGLRQAASFDATTSVPHHDPEVRSQDNDLNPTNPLKDVQETSSDTSQHNTISKAIHAASTSSNELDKASSSTVSSKPKIRIKLKLSPKKEESQGSDDKNESIDVKMFGVEGRAQPLSEGSDEDEEDWLCLKCINHNAPKRIRCWNCKGWKGGKRENFNPNKNKDDDDDHMDADLEPAVLSENLDKSIPDKAEPQESMKPSESIDEDTPVTTVKPKPSKKKKSKPHALNNASPSSQSSISKSQPSVAKFSNDAPKKKKSHPKTKLFSGTLRSAAAAHRNRQIHIPPIGSPGLLMLPNPALVANFPSDDGSKRKITIDDVAHLLHNGCLLPRTVFEQSMIAGGYTRNKRKNTPHRGSSTERTVDDMFDSDVNLYLHFPELISLDVWERRMKNTKFEVKAEEREDNKASDKQVEITTVEENGLTKSTANKEVTPPDQAVAASVDEDKGPMLVDMVIQSLTKYTGNSFTSDAAGSSKLDPTSLDPAVSVEPSPSGGVASNHIPKVKSSLSKRKRSCLSFFDMIPISLTATYPPDYVDKRRAYIHAVKEREDMIVESQEAFDDNVDNHEKYSAHKEAWDRMFEYQKQQIAKREAAAAEVEQKTKKEAEIPGVKNHQRSESDESDKKDRKNPINKSKKGEQKDEGRKEDPMDYMPQPPQLPPPERFVDVPEIPTPPSPPSVVELEQISGDVTTTDEKTEGRINKMYVSKVDPKLIQHLDPACFLPTSEGRYFGLLSNSIADPQFVGHAASGIRGVTSGGGTGLATSYIGGGRGAAGLVSGPLRGGMHSWQSRESSVSNGTTSPLADSSKQTNKKEKREPIINTKQATNKKKSPEKPLPSSSSKTKRQVSETEGSDAEGGKKKIARVIPLATGDRNTLATEIASGPAGDEFPDGWTVKTYRRAGGETVGKTDRFWFSPGLNIRFRAKKHAMSFIEIMAEPEVNGDEQIAAETYRARGLMSFP